MARSSDEVSEELSHIKKYCNEVLKKRLNVMNEKIYATVTYVIFRHVPIVEGSKLTTLTIPFNENHTKEHGNSSRAHDCCIERSTKCKK